MTGELPPTPTAWPLSMWDLYTERCSIHEAEGLAPVTARIRAEQECRAWRRAVPDERAWLESLPPPPPGTGALRPLSARYERRPGSPSVAPGRAQRR